MVNYKNPDKDAVCHCKEYSHTCIDEHHPHVMTGDFNLIGNVNIRDLIAKGLDFRETYRPDKTKALQSFQGAIDRYIGRISRRLSLQKHVFTPWKSAILNTIKEYLNGLQPYSFNNVLGTHENREYVCKLQEHFIFTSVDEAGNIVSIVCKSFYYDTLYNDIITTL